MAGPGRCPALSRIHPLAGPRRCPGYIRWQDREEFSRTSLSLLGARRRRFLLVRRVRFLLVRQVRSPLVRRNPAPVRPGTVKGLSGPCLRWISLPSKNNGPRQVADRSYGAGIGSAVRTEVRTDVARSPRCPWTNDKKSVCHRRGRARAVAPGSIVQVHPPPLGKGVNNHASLLAQTHTTITSRRSHHS